MTAASAVSLKFLKNLPLSDRNFKFKNRTIII